MKARQAFRGGKAGMTIDGTFRLGSFKTIKDFEWGVTELPANAEGKRSNYASYFANGIGAKTKGDKLEASKKFLAYISSPAAMDIWLKTVGELPARRSAALTDANLKDPVFGPFLKGLEYAHTTMFKDEAAQRQNAIDMVNRVLLEKQPVKDSLSQAAEAEQEIIDAAKPDQETTMAVIEQQGAAKGRPGGTVVTAFSMHQAPALVWGFLALPILFYTVIRFYPTLQAFYLSFTNWDLLRPAKLVGFAITSSFSRIRSSGRCSRTPSPI